MESPLYKYPHYESIAQMIDNPIFWLVNYRKTIMFSENKTTSPDDFYLSINDYVWGSTTTISYVILYLWQPMAMCNPCLGIVQECTQHMTKQMGDSGSDRHVM